MKSSESDSLLKLTNGAVSCFLLFVPLISVGSGGGHDFARICQLGILALAALGLAAGRPRYRWPTAIWAKVVLTLAAVLPLLSTLFAADQPMLAARELIVTLGLVALAWVLSRSCRQPSGLALALKGVILAWALYFACFLLVFAVVVVSSSGVNLWLMVFGFDNPRFLNHAQTVGVPLLLGTLAWPGLAARWRALAWFALVMNLAVLAMSFGRATWLGVLTVIALTALAFGPAGRSYALRAALSLVLGGLVYLALFRMLPGTLGPTAVDGVPGLQHAVSDHSRFYLWEIARSHIAASPWLGIGPMHFAHFPNSKGAHPHNVFLQVAAEYGLPMLSLLLGGVMWGLWKAARRIRQQLLDAPNETWGLGAFCACVAALIDGFFSGNFVMPVSQMWISLAVGLLIAACAQEAPSVGRPAARSGRGLRALAVLLLMAQMLNLAASAREFAMERPRLSSQNPAADVEEKWRPRFWLDGWF